MNKPPRSKISAVITGATGMVGEGIVHECLMHNDVENVLLLSRKPSGIVHPKLREVLHNDFFNLAAVEQQLVGYNACFFCLGVSSVGMNEQDYTKMTYTLTMQVAGTLCRLNAGMVFSYISGAGTDSTEKGRSMWARVKGKTENDLLKLPFKKVYAFRPGIIEPTAGLKNTLKLYTYFGWLLPVMRTFFPKYFCTLSELGLAMINSASLGYEKQVLEVKDIVALSKR
ncbi:MAG TPA: epimerase [Bacteroidia bacterium]|nr:epimerase [Bacteroidia bacterium]